jgi:transcriptional regulator with XRE-family HTH domain
MRRPKFNTLADRLSWARSVSGLNLSGLSLHAGLSKSHVGMIERGERAEPTRKTIQALASALGVSKAWLEDGEGDPPTEAQIKKAVAGAA